jgi:diadenosine tetraphosphate (Ap4A) HIT family hydrolase
MEDDCLACALTAGREPLPGGLIHRTQAWLVEHCVGPLGLGTLIVKPERHVTAVADLSPAETAELGPLLQQASWVASQLVDSDQVYNCLWSHRGGVPVHIHYVIQPVTREQTAAYLCNGPRLQAAIVAAGITPDPTEIASVADHARQLFQPVRRALAR